MTPSLVAAWYTIIQTKITIAIPGPTRWPISGASAKLTTPIQGRNRLAIVSTAKNGGTPPHPNDSRFARRARQRPATQAVSAVGDTLQAVADEQPGKLEAQVSGLVDAARELDAALATHWAPLKRAQHDWENAAASTIPGVQLTHGILARLEPELVEQLVVPKPARRKR